MSSDRSMQNAIWMNLWMIHLLLLILSYMDMLLWLSISDLWWVFLRKVIRVSQRCLRRWYWVFSLRRIRIGIWDFFCFAIVCIGVSPPPLSCQAPALHLQTVQATFLGSFPLLDFLTPPKIQIFQWTPKVSILNSFLSFKSN